MDKRTDTTWWSRNWKWAIPVLFAVVAVGFCGVFVLLFSLVRGILTSSGAYKEAITRMQTNQQVIAQLGSPLEASMHVSGHVNSNSNGSGSAQLAIPVSGPNGSAILYVRAYESTSQWTFCRLFVQTKHAGKRIDLLDENRVARDHSCTQNRGSSGKNSATTRI